MKTSDEKLPAIGSIISTKHDGRFDCVTSVIKNAYDNSIEIEFVDGYLSKIIFVDDILICKASNQKTSHILQCIVKDINISSHSIVLEITDSKIVPNFRIEKRYDTSLISNISLNGNKEYYSAIMNISLKGLSMVTKCAIPPNEEFNLQVFLSKALSVNFLCQVKWENTIGNSNLYGLLISEVSKKDKVIYNEFIDRLEENENKLITTIRKKK